MLRKNVVLTLHCSTISGLMTRDAFHRLLSIEWLARPACILNLLFLLIIGVAFPFACKIDSSFFEKLPREERERILMRRLVSTSWVFKQDGTRNTPECKRASLFLSGPDALGRAGVQPA